MSDDDLHCGSDCGDIDAVECEHCECCCDCLGCIYAPRDGMPLTAEQRAPIAAIALEYPDVPPNVGSAS